MAGSSAATARTRSGSTKNRVFTGGVKNDLLVVAKTGVVPAGMKFGSADAGVSVTGTVRALWSPKSKTRSALIYVGIGSRYAGRAKPD